MSKSDNEYNDDTPRYFSDDEDFTMREAPCMREFEEFKFEELNTDFEFVCEKMPSLRFDDFKRHAYKLMALYVQASRQDNDLGYYDFLRGLSVEQLTPIMFPPVSDQPVSETGDNKQASPVASSRSAGAMFHDSNRETDSTDSEEVSSSNSVNQLSIYSKKG